jgi:glycosyltransferase involved in cell wall biosynthesis
MKITILTGYFPPEVSADSNLVQELGTDFAQYGAEVTIVAPFPSRGVTAEVQGQFIGKPEEILSENLKVIRVGRKRDFKQGIFRRWCSFLQKSLDQYRVAKKIETDMYFVFSTPPVLGYIAVLLAKKKAVIYQMNDIFPDSLMLVKNWSDSSVVAKVLRMLECKIYKKVSKINVLSADMKVKVIEHGGDEHKISTINNWVDASKIVPVGREKNCLFAMYNVDKDDFYVSYAGNIGLLQNIETIVRAAEKTGKEYPMIKYVIFGEGACRTRIERLIIERTISNVFLFPLQNEDLISQVYSFGDVEVVSLKSGVTRIAFPSKLMNVFATARPVICEADLDSELCSIIKENHIGEVVSPGDEAAMANAIIFMYNNRKLLSGMGIRARQYVVENYSKAIQTTKLFELTLKKINVRKSGQKNV